MQFSNDSVLTDVNFTPYTETKVRQ